MKRILLVSTLFLMCLNVFSQDLSMADGTFNACSGTLFDSGGEFGNYGNNETTVMTICPDASGDFVQLVFQTFSTQINADSLTIYDGDSTAAPQLGTWSGGGSANSPGTVTASPSNTSGCLTLEFISDAAASGQGWSADILCGMACQDITASIDSTNPPANADGVVVVSPGDSITFSGSGTFSDDDSSATYTWSFGNGNSLTGQTVTYVYPSTPGVYTVTFTASDNNPTGCSGTDTIQVEVLAPYVQVDADMFTDIELVQDVLIDSGCADTDNIVGVTGTNFGTSFDGIGYFWKSGSNFPFDYGVILSSGKCEDAAGPETGNASSGSGAWPGDADLEGLMPWVDPGTTNNASYIEFSFIPLANQISFDFIFGSEEYGTYQCGYSDAFAFLLTEEATGVQTNLAVVPGTTTPISVFSVRDNQWNGGCASANEQYFGEYYGFGGLPAANAPTNIKGTTVPMTAIGNVTPYTLYTIKLVVADDNDSILDSVVFLNGGSFNLGGELGDDLTIAANNTYCEDEGVTLSTNVPAGDGDHIWYHDGIVMTGEVNHTITVYESGTYAVEIILSDDCFTSDSVYVEFYPSPEIVEVEDMAMCDPGAPPYMFDLTYNESLILGTQDNADEFEITFHNSQADADADVNPIPTPETYSGTDDEVIYVRIDYPGADCYATATFTLDILFSPILNPVADLETCDDVSNDGTEAFDLDAQTLAILGPIEVANYTVTYHDSFADADAGVDALVSPYNNIPGGPQPIYIRLVHTVNGCPTVPDTPVFNLIVHPRAEATQPDNMVVCDDVSNDGFETFDLTSQNAAILG
ncbi:choice-of-anchor L domain-containing protein, partial [Mangrovimonas aestuarii]|uniref:choice-of-anchor L domain-containing protein n=1 Tax=Mangrovimonas aestuarii TaxID=3018443 RepID=UPI002378B007